MLSLIVAHDNKLGIGKNQELPWHLPGEMSHFKSTTLKVPETNQINAVIMGRKTWESIPTKYRPLNGRINIVLTSNENYFKDTNLPNTFRASSLQCAVDFLTAYTRKHLDENLHQVFVIGGASLYQETLKREDLQKIYLTEVYQDFECDTLLAEKKELKQIMSHYDLLNVSPFHLEKNIHYRFFEYQRKNLNPDTVIYHNSEEQQYLDLLYKILNDGIKRGDRTGTGTLSVFGEVQKFNLRETFPILTTKRIFFKAVFEELMLYLRGQTDNKILNEKNIHIWDGNTSREFLDKRQLYSYEEGDMGETYGFNFRHFGGEYSGCQYEYEKGKNGFDQLQNVLQLIKHNPESRRIIISLWNPHTEHKAALPSCLCWYQFYVNPYEKTLSLLINIRSSDFFLANNWNVCTGALLTHLICNLDDIDLTPGDLTVISGDTHIYLNHTDQALENLERVPRPFPKLLVKKTPKNIEDYQYEDIELLGYNPYPNIKASMAV